ncbi:hypothetical protein LOK49_LG08G00274 [Camellia lanceoleosa]|uniref:Uncharacterized protein n=1 Tax=Camellia lanceoleosa TaxID=1840588 RepID=A0ACC0GME9_9ERIC|nr:hypothetical protein LOK49_LG08G00274 [Camellia lanceoleosa]
MQILRYISFLKIQLDQSWYNLLCTDLLCNSDHQINRSSPQTSNFAATNITDAQTTQHLATKTTQHRQHNSKDNPAQSREPTETTVEQHSQPTSSNAQQHLAAHMHSQPIWLTKATQQNYPALPPACRNKQSGQQTTPSYRINHGNTPLQNQPSNSRPTQHSRPKT